MKRLPLWVYRVLPVRLVRWIYRDELEVGRREMARIAWADDDPPSNQKEPPR